MFIVGTVSIGLFVSQVRMGLRNRPKRLRAALPQSGRRESHHRKLGIALIGSLTAAALLFPAGLASAAIVPAVPLGTAADYAVLGATTVTNTGDSVLNGSLGVSPGSAVTGFPPGLVMPPGVIDAGNEAAANAQLALTAAYLNAAGRPLNATITAEMDGLTLVGGVYAGPDKAPLSLAGTLTLDGENDPNSVFIFQTNSTLITASGSTVELINGAQECNVFWQVGSSASLGSGSVFVGNILALTSITVNNSVTIHGRALAQNGAVTLDNDTFAIPTCQTTPDATTTTSTPGTTSSTVFATTTTDQGTTSTTFGDITTTTEGATSTTESIGSTSTILLDVAGDVNLNQELPLTGQSFGMMLLAAFGALAAGATLVISSRRGKVSRSDLERSR